MRSLAMMSLVLGACGSGVSQNPGGDAPIDTTPVGCTPEGTGTVTGTSMGASIGPIASAYQMAAGGMYVIVLDDRPGVCGPPAASGLHINLIFCAQPSVQRYPVASEGGWSCPNDAPIAVIKDDITARDHAEGLFGTIDITSTDDSCVTGMYEIDFDTGGAGSASGDRVSGEFNAVVCD